MARFLLLLSFYQLLFPLFSRIKNNIFYGCLFFAGSTKGQSLKNTRNKIKNQFCQIQGIIILKKRRNEIIEKKNVKKMIGRDGRVEFMEV